MAESLTVRVKKLEGSLQLAFAGVDVYELDAPVRKLVQGVKRDMTDVRLDVRDYEFADTLADQQRSGKAARKRLQKIEKHVLSLSEHGLVGAADVAEYSARIDDLLKEFND
jgi:hypothetical protein